MRAALFRSRRGGLHKALQPIESHSIRKGAVLVTARQKISLRVAGVCFGAWVLLGLALADFPPPPGFAILLVVLLACAVLVYLRVPVYLRWRAEDARGRTLRVARDGLLGGAAIALLSLLSPGDPSIRPDLSDRLIGTGVLIVLGIVNALAAYSFGLWLCRRRPG